MKKLIILLILIISIFLTSCTTLYVLNPSQITMPDDIEFINLVKQLDTPEKICQYMQENFTFKNNPEYTPSPYTLWQIKEGDCNDFSTFACFIANYHGYETYQIIIGYENIESKHSLAVFKEGKYYTFSSNYYYTDIAIESFKDIMKHITFSNWTEYTVYDYNMNVVEHKTNSL